jgi:hypothetical protein
MAANELVQARIDDAIKKARVGHLPRVNSIEELKQSLNADYH